MTLDSIRNSCDVLLLLFFMFNLISMFSFFPFYFFGLPICTDHLDDLDHDDLDHDDHAQEDGGADCGHDNEDQACLKADCCSPHLGFI